MISILNNEIKFNTLCHAMIKNNLFLACTYATDIFNNSISYKDRSNKGIKASLLTVRSFLLCIPFINRIIQFALRILSPELTKESVSYFGEEERKIRYSAEVLLSYSSQGSQTPASKSLLLFLSNQEKEFPALIDNSDAFEKLLLGQEITFGQLTEEEKLRFESWLKEQLNEDIEDAATHIQNSLDELD